MNNYILFIDGNSVSLADFLKETGLTEEIAKILLGSGIPMKTMKGKVITYKIVER